MKTVAIIISCDTKYPESVFLKQEFLRKCFKPLIVDISIGLDVPKGADISREEVFESIGVDWETVKEKSKGELIALMGDAIVAKIHSLFVSGKIDGVMSVGGVQNTLVSAKAMRALPLGVPKVIATTIASGKREFGSIVDDKDIVVIPSISDFTGLNVITKMSMMHAVDCVAGMLLGGETALKKRDGLTVGVSLMGVTNTGAQAAISELERYGVEAIGFHSTGVGGLIMDKLACEGFIDGILDLNVHELAAEYFGGGFSYGRAKRLTDTIENEIPMIVTPAGLDFVDYDVSSVPFDLSKRKYNMHNATLAHIKITKNEAIEIGRLFGNRISKSKKEIQLLVPTEGFRANTRKGESLYDPEIDKCLLDTIMNSSGGKLCPCRIEGNLNDESWGKQAADKMLSLLERDKV